MVGGVANGFLSRAPKFCNEIYQLNIQIKLIFLKLKVTKMSGNRKNGFMRGNSAGRNGAGAKKFFTVMLVRKSTDQA